MGCTNEIIICIACLFVFYYGEKLVIMNAQSWLLAFITTQVSFLVVFFSTVPIPLILIIPFT